MAHYPGLRCGRVLDPNVARPLSRAATMINVRGRGTFSSFVAVRRTMSYSCRTAASGSIRDARLAGQDYAVAQIHFPAEVKNLKLDSLNHCGSEFHLAVSCSDVAAD